MLSEIVAKFDKNRTELEKFFKSKHPGSYQEIVEQIVKLIFPDESMVVKEVTVGDYQGTLIYIIVPHSDSLTIYYTHSYYGSCAGCDALLEIQGRGDEPNEPQVEDYMLLALHIVQKMKVLEIM